VIVSFLTVICVTLSTPGLEFELTIAVMACVSPSTCDLRVQILDHEQRVD
jgi:hypothetical protein